MAEAGSSGHDARRRAIEAIPLRSMPEPQRRAVEKSIASATLYRHLPAETITCDAALLEFILAKPESLVDLWRVLGISRLALDPAGPSQWRLADGYGTVGTVRLLHRERTAQGSVLVFHGRGGYAGSLSPKPLTGSCLVVVRHAPAGQDPQGRERQTVQIDAFLDVDGMGLEIVTRTLRPLIVRSAAANMHEICLFVSQFSAAAKRSPAGVARLTERMSRTSPEDRRALASIACGSPRTPARAATAEQMQAELAARWMSAEQIDGDRRRQ